MTQYDFARLLGLSPVTVSRWEHDHAKPTPTSNALFDLLERALRRESPAVIIARLEVSKTEAQRLITLVHLGDRPV